MKYPESKRGDVIETLHGREVADPYRWLEDLDTPQTQAWVAAQRAFAEEALAAIPARERIRARVAQLWDYEKLGVPHRRGGRLFCTHNDGLQNQSILYWRPDADGELQVLLDPNGLSEDGTVALTGYAVSEDGRYLAYGLSSAGSDWQEWYVREVESGHDLDDHLRWVKFSGAAWTADGQALYYSRYEAPEEGVAYKGANYGHQVYLHRLGTPQDEDVLVYERPDHKEWLFHSTVSEDGRYLVVHVSKGTHEENGLFYQDLEGGEMVELLSDFDAAYTYVGSDGSAFYLITNLDAPMSRLVAFDVNQPDRDGWREVIPESEDVLRDVSLVGDRFVASYLHDAHSVVRVYDKEGAAVGEVDLPGLGSVYGFDGRQDDVETFYQYTDFSTPGTIYRYDVQAGKSEIHRQPRVGFDPQHYVSDQVSYPSLDGTQIPMFLVRRRDIEMNPETPVCLYGYGGFNIPQLPAFSARNLAWLEMGGVFAMANLRGGGEYGRTWHEAGMVLTKQNVFDDFIAAAEWLIGEGYTSRDKLAIMGRSNGGLLVGACMTQRPDLFGACLPGVGVLDMLSFHKWTIGWAWVSDYGSPDDPKEFEALLAYSPYHNVRRGTAFPPTLITTGDHDDRVFPAHSFKFGAALQWAQAGEAPILIRIDTRSGHGVGKPTSKLIEETADQWAFVVDALGMDI